MSITRLIITSFFILPVFCFGQQVPNAGFENWANAKTPDNWISGSSLSIISNQCNQNQSDKISGTGSAEIRTEKVGSFATSWDFISLGSGDWSISKGYTFKPVPFAFRPDSFLFYYKYTTTTTDSALMKIKFTKAGTVLLEEEKVLLVNNKWEQVTMNLTGLYKSAGTPDSVLIQFYSSKPRPGFFGVAGSVLRVDELRMGYKSTASIQAKESTLCRIYPNPVDQYISVETPNPGPEVIFTVYTATGTQVFSQTLHTSHSEVNTSIWPSGIYYYTVKTNGGVSSTGKLSVCH